MRYEVDPISTNEVKDMLNQPGFAWDILYFGVLISIVFILIPSRSSSAYVHSYQIPSTDMLDEFDGSALEMSAPAHASITTQNERSEYSPKLANINEIEEEEEEYIDIGLDEDRKSNKSIIRKIINE